MYARTHGGARWIVCMCVSKHACKSVHVFACSRACAHMLASPLHLLDGCVQARTPLTLAIASPPCASLMPPAVPLKTHPGRTASALT